MRWLILSRSSGSSEGHWRSGETNQAIATLEDDLDTQILFIGGITEATPIAERDKQWLSRIRWLRDYRAEYPRKTESPVLAQAGCSSFVFGAYKPMIMSTTRG
ncbi:MAG: hypothetical protein V9H26_23815 [Verrucomicrobiota bacterium]